MQRLRSTFKRSRTPTGAEMKSQSSLEVPKQVRSASFDEIQLEAKRQDGVRTRDSQSPVETPYPHGSNHPASALAASATSNNNETSSHGAINRYMHQESGVRRLTTLRVPQLRSNQRSKSFDACAIDKRNAGGSSPPSNTFQISGCYHCACVEEYKRQQLARKNQEAGESPSAYAAGRTLLDDDYESEREENDEDEDADEDDNHLDDSAEEETDEDGARAVVRRRERSDRDREHSPEILVTLTGTESPYPSSRRRSVASPKLSRQEALTSFPADLTLGSTRDDNETDDTEGSPDPSATDTDTDEKSPRAGRLVVRDIFLAVPELKRDRAASVDSCFNGSKNAEKSGPSQQGLLAVPQQSLRSKSVDIVLPTDVQTRYTALLPSSESRRLRG